MRCIYSVKERTSRSIIVEKRSLIKVICIVYMYLIFFICVWKNGQKDV